MTAGIDGLAPAALQDRVEALLDAGTTPEHLAKVRRRLGWQAPPLAVVDELDRQPRLGGAAPDRADSPNRVLVCGLTMPARLALTWEFGGPLWVRLRGNSLPVGPAVAVVGTRRPTLDGLTVAGRIAQDLAAAQVAVISGMARGIDQAAHRGALAAGGPTVGVLGTGHDIDYPAGSGRLRDAVAASGGVVSEYAAGRGISRRSQFIDRNRILAGLADGVVVVEAGARSGALNTANIAADLGRPVMVVPSSPSNGAAAGALGLLADGAVPVRDAADVTGVIDADVHPPRRDGQDLTDGPDPPADPGAAAVLHLTGPVAASPSALADATGLTPREVLVALSTLEDAGRVVRTARGVVRKG